MNRKECCAIIGCGDEQLLTSAHVYHGPAVYFIFQNNALAYVGATSSLSRRLRDHASCITKPEDHCFIPFDGVKAARVYEKAIIAAAQPPLNVCSNPKHKYAVRNGVSPLINVVVAPMPQANSDEVCRLIRATIQASKEAAP